MINVDKGNPVSDSFNLFIEAAITTQKYADSTFYRRAGISIPKYSFLKILSTAEHAVTPSEIARKTFRERHDITTLMQRMKRDGLVDITPSTTDRRSVIITLTEKGREKLDQAEPVAEEIINQVMSKIGKTNMASMNKILNTLKQNSIDGLEQLSRTPRK
jgi:DNA-binding MarR family transcriptional regulator